MAATTITATTAAAAVIAVASPLLSSAACSLQGRLAAVALTTKLIPGYLRRIQRCPGFVLRPVHSVLEPAVGFMT